MYLLQSPFACIYHADTVIYIAYGLIQPGNLSPHFLGDGQPGGIIARPDDTISGL